ncbi:MAG: hypothetical protein AAAC49_24510, partial [Rhizobium leguminosarum]
SVNDTAANAVAKVLFISLSFSNRDGSIPGYSPPDSATDNGRNRKTIPTRHHLRIACQSAWEGATDKHGYGSAPIGTFRRHHFASSGYFTMLSAMVAGKARS